MVSYVAHTRVLAASLLWTIAMKPCLGVREDTTIEGEKRGSLYNVDLIVTRHGLSCANIVSEFKAGGIKARYKNLGGNRKIEDPILAQAGVQGSLQMGEISKHVKPDAVLASTLLRAIETAMLQYPSDAVHIVPWIRESSALTKYPGFGEGKDNLPKDRQSQIDRLREELNGIFSNSGMAPWQYSLSDWTDNDTREYNHNWENFKAFLKMNFLPWIIRNSGKQPGSTITLAVVTHSHFMAKEPDIKNYCGEFWSGNGKPYNNQAVNISYVYELTELSSSDVDPETQRRKITYHAELQQKEGCSQAAPGLQYKKRTLCRRDIGGSCESDIAEKKLNLPEHLEEMITKKMAEQEGYASKIENAVTNMKDKLENLDVNRDSFHKNEAKVAEAHEKKVKSVKEKNMALHLEIESLRQTQCIGDHGHPDA